MPKLSRLAGSTSHVLQLFVQDSSQTDGRGLTGLVFNSGSLACYYKRNLSSSSTAVTLATITTLGTYATGGFKEVDATNMPGVYEFHPPDAAYASGAKSVVFILRGATNMAPVLIEVELTAVDNQDGAAFGISRLDATVTSRMASYTQPTGFLAATFPSSVASPTNITAGTIANVSGSVLSVTNPVTVNAVNGLAPPTNWNLSAIDGSGRVVLQPTQPGVTIPTVTGVTNAVTVGGYSSGQDPATLVLDVAASGHNTAGTIGQKINSAGSAGNPWTTDVSTGYTGNQAGALLFGNLDAKVSTRSTYAGGPVSAVTAGVTLAAAGLDAIVVETGVNARQALSPILAACAGVLSGATTGTVVVKGGNVATTRVTATTDINGNRTSVTLNLPT